MENKKRRQSEDIIKNQLQAVTHNRWLLMFYDLCVFVIAVLLILVLNPSSSTTVITKNVAIQSLIGFICIFGSRLLLGVYRQIWRYGNTQSFFLLLLADCIGGVLFFIADRFLPIGSISFIRMLSFVCVDMIGVFATRMLYQVMYVKVGKNETWLNKAFYALTGIDVKPDEYPQGENQIRIAIIGAGHIGVGLAEELKGNPKSNYLPVCFIDHDEAKSGRSILGIPVISEKTVNADLFVQYGVQEVVFAVPNLPLPDWQKLYAFYKETGRKVKVYDFPIVNADESGKRSLRDFDIEDLLFRKPINIQNQESFAYYRNKVVLVTGGGGSIGSELCRQIAKMQPQKLIVLDICENGAYEIQQELKITYGENIHVCIEIVSVCNRDGLERVFKEYSPDIVLHAAAHKHVPLMEKNCCEAVLNNVFGTLNVVELSEQYKVQRFIMISTDKAVNPTNVMGATKRMCEMIVLSRSRNNEHTAFSATRFGNVLGSAGSVIPLFRKQIAHGGPITVTDKRIIRYFMTIPEAAQLVLQSGVMAKNGELFVLDMGKPVSIWELAENMIHLSGYEVGKDIEIVETGLRPGEKLYEELLIQSESLSKTENDLIFVERDDPLMWDEIQRKLQTLELAVQSGNDALARAALHQAVPTFCETESANNAVIV